MNKLMPILLLPFLAFILFSCTDQRESEEKTNQRSKVYDNISVIEGMPENIKGCSCALARNKEEFEAEKFIYIESYGKLEPEKNIAMISLDGQQIIYPRKTPPEGLQVLVLYKSKGGGKSDPEMNIRRGKLAIKQENGATLKEDFYGVCGC